MQHLIRKEVEVITAETVYRGILIEVGEAEIHLQGENGWITVPAYKVLDIREVERSDLF